MERRPPKQTDQQVIERAYLLLKECMYEHPEIEPTLWAGAFWSVLINGYNDSGISHEEFVNELEKIKVHYKDWFDT